MTTARIRRTASGKELTKLEQFADELHREWRDRPYRPARTAPEAPASGGMTSAARRPAPRPGPPGRSA